MSSAKRGQYFNNYRQSFQLGRDAESNWSSAKIKTNSVTKARQLLSLRKQPPHIGRLSNPSSPSPVLVLRSLFSRPARPNSVNKHFIIDLIFYVVQKREEGEGLVNKWSVYNNNQPMIFDILFERMQTRKKRGKNHSIITQTTVRKMSN